MKSIFWVFTICAVLFGTAASATNYIGTDQPTYTTDATAKSTQYATGLIVPKAFLQQHEDVAPMKVFEGELPKKFDWREKGLTPIRNQGNCGSCWAFAATAMLADHLKLKGITGYEDLSEQDRVSCDRENSGCNGGWLGQDYQKDVGVALEVDFPYTASNARCKDVAHYHKIQSWNYIESENELPSAEKLKRAIYTWGPITVAVSASGDFMSYKSGVYNSASSGSINHAVNLVGWDDTTTPSYFIMRNSWGTSWGESGYMRIAYPAKRIGYGGVSISLDGKPLTPDQPVPPPPPPGPCPPPVKACPDTFMEKLGCFFR